MNIVFDLDGTLVDSAPDLQAAVNHMLAGEGAAPLDRATIVSFVGNGLPKLVERAMAARGLPSAQFPRLYASVDAFYKRAPVEHTRPFPHVPEALTALKAAGHRLGICTNKPEEPARLVLDLLGLASFFDVVVGGDTLDEKKPHPAPLLNAAAALGDGARLYVGDSAVDAETARAAELPFALFTRGYRSEPVEALAPDTTFDDFATLAALVAAMPSARSAA